MSAINVGIAGTGIYLPKKVMTAADISRETRGVWSEEAVREKLGINQKYIPEDGIHDGTQEMLDKFAAMTMLGRLGQPHEIASAALFLASDESGYITGQVLVSDGGWSHGTAGR